MRSCPPSAVPRRAERRLLLVPRALLRHELEVALRRAAHLLVALGGAEGPLGQVEALGAELRHADQELHRAAAFGLRLREALLERGERRLELLALEVDLAEQHVEVAVGRELRR